jgi:hypothetical protein
MKHERHHWLEKLQVEFAGAAALAVTFFIVGPMHGSWDPQWPATFVPTGSVGGLLSLALLVWLLATACALLTISARPEGALLATLVGAAGVSMHSAPIRVLFWSKEASLAGVFIQLIAELLVLFVIVLGAVHIIHQIRALITRLYPNWMWKGRITAESYSPQTTLAKSVSTHREPEDSPSWILWFLSPIGHSFLDQIRLSDNMSFISPQQQAKSRKTALVCTISCLAATVLYSSILLMLLMRSSLRGQIIFALFASFLLATLIAHQQFATRFSLAAWAAPLVTGIVFYMLAMASSGNTGTNIWIEVQPFARALPIDWMTAGAGGSVLGYWISERIHELRHIERHAENISA